MYLGQNSSVKYYSEIKEKGFRRYARSNDDAFLLLLEIKASLIQNGKVELMMMPFIRDEYQFSILLSLPPP